MDLESGGKARQHPLFEDRAQPWEAGSSGEDEEYITVGLGEPESRDQKVQVEAGKTGERSEGDDDEDAEAGEDLENPFPPQPPPRASRQLGTYCCFRSSVLLSLFFSLYKWTHTLTCTIANRHSRCLSLSPYTHTPTPSASLSLALFLFLYTTYTISLLQAHPYKFLPLFAKQFSPLLFAHSSVCIASQARGPIPLFSSKWWGGSIPVIVVILLVRFFSCWCRFGLLFTSLSLSLSCSRATCPAFNSACTSWWAWLQW